MTKNQESEIRIKRKRAIELLASLSLNWDDTLYHYYDFSIDNIIRSCTDRPPKDIGKEPYEYIEL